MILDIITMDEPGLSGRAIPAEVPDDTTVLPFARGLRVLIGPANENGGPGGRRFHVSVEA